MFIPNRNKTTVIENEGSDLASWPVDQLPYKAEDGTIQGSGMRVLSSGSLLAPVGFASVKTCFWAWVLTSHN